MTPQALKASILQLAIQGKLVPQRSEEGTAEELYQQIQVEKQALIANGTIKREKALPPIKEDEIPFDIPETWKWVRLGNICTKLTDGSHNPPPKTESGYRVISAKNIKNGSIIFESNDRFCDRQGFYKENPRTKISKKDIILGIIGGSIGNVAVYQHDDLVVAQRSIAIINTLAENLYLKVFLESGHCQHLLAKKSNGSAQGGVYLGELSNLLFPLPPLEEQKRIVAKIEEMLPLIDRYGEAYTELETFNKRFPDDLRKSILQQAIQGKLVPQLPEEGTAEELYQQIQTEKQRLIASGTIKKEKPLPPIEEKDLPFDIPETWKWVQLGEMVYNRGQKVPNADFSYIDIGSIDNKQNKLNETDNIIEASKAPSRARKIVDIGDILYATVRPYLHNTCIIDREFSAEPIASTGFAAMTCLKGVYNKYLFYYLLSPEFDTYANSTDNAKGMAYPAISDKRLYKAPIALPPLAEQQRIVAKIEEMLTHCKTLQ